MLNLKFTVLAGLAFVLVGSGGCEEDYDPSSEDLEGTWYCESMKLKHNSCDVDLELLGGSSVTQNTYYWTFIADDDNVLVYTCGTDPACNNAVNSGIYTCSHTIRVRIQEMLVLDFGAQMGDPSIDCKMYRTGGSYVQFEFSDSMSGSVKTSEVYVTRGADCDYVKQQLENSTNHADREAVKFFSSTCEFQYKGPLHKQ